MLTCSSSSSSSNYGRSYEVFLSFRGEDTRKTFVGHLFNALIEKGIHTFMDDKELKRGRSISSELMKAIGESKFAVVVFSKNYASSTWCLEELVKILEIHEKFELIVVPVFYDVDPSTVRKQNGEYAVFFTKFEAELVDDKDKVIRWREALTKVANISGHDLRNTYNGSVVIFVLNSYFHFIPKSYTIILAIVHRIISAWLFL